MQKCRFLFPVRNKTNRTETLPKLTLQQLFDIHLFIKHFEFIIKSVISKIITVLQHDLLFPYAYTEHPKHAKVNRKAKF